MNRVAVTLLAAATIGALAGCSSTADTSADAPTTVTTSSGQLHGVLTGDARQFLGVRYALAPTGARRWTLPEPAPAAPGVVDATKPGQSCAQSSPLAPPSTAEDCLFVNVTTPRTQQPGQKLPVMVWWHGGGFMSGSGSEYDPTRLASQGGVVVVTVNYRLGVFGYLGLPGLAGSGNFGLADQIAATRWAKTNAAAFGGDPGNITVFGESAGGMSACALLTSPAAAGLVQRIAISSGSCLLHWPAGGIFPGIPDETPYKPLATTESDSMVAAKTLGCKDSSPIACLRGKPVGDLLKISGNFSDHLTYGTDLVPVAPADAVRAGTVARIPVLSGGNRDEHNSFIAAAVTAAPKSITAATYPALVKTAFGTAAPQVMQHYPLARFPSPAAAWSQVNTDRAWSCPTLTGDRELSAVTTVHGYEFADDNAPNLTRSNIPGLPMRAAHATDLPYLFDLHGNNLLKAPGQPELARTMIAYWSSFARTGVPTAPGAPAMPAVTASADHVVSLAPGAVRVADTAAAHNCGFWQSVP